MKKILIICSSIDEKKNLEKSFFRFRKADMEIEFTTTFNQPPSYWVHESAPHVLLLQLPEFTDRQKFTIEKFKKEIPHDLPCVFLCKEIPPQLMIISEAFTRVRILKSPYSGDEIFSKISELTDVQSLETLQNHPRFLVDESVRIYSADRLSFTSAILKNLSLKGCYFEVKSRGFFIKTGDVVLIRIMVGGFKLYEINAKVMWSTRKDAKDIQVVLPEADQDGIVGYGAIFIREEDVYGYLLKQMSFGESKE